MHKEKKEWRDMQLARVEVVKEATLEISISTLMISLVEEVHLETDKVEVVKDSNSTLEVEVTKVASSTKEDSNNNSKNNQ